MQLNVNTDEAVKFTNRLEKLSNTAMPNVVCDTLNKTALDLKQNTMPKSSDRFVHRQANFFKATSTIEFAKGKNLSTMKSVVGFKGTQQAVQDLEKQEEGGTIGGRAFIPLNAARVGNSVRKNVRSNYRLSVIRNKIINPKNARGVNEGQRFIKSVFFAGKGGFVLGKKGGKEILWKVNSLKRNDKGSLKLTALYSVKKGRDVSVNETSFMRSASIQSAKGMENTYVLLAKKRIEQTINP